MEQKYLDELVAVDLHVHTPASNCYRRKNSDLEGEYIDILKQYIEKNVKVIGITDHNSISGYKELVRIKKTSEEKIRTWQELSNIPEVQLKIEAEKEKLELFNRVLIIPGVEFEANPGVHILFLFNPTTTIDEIEKFISQNGYSLDNQGKEDVEVATISAIEIIRKGYDMGAITIAAHVDSSKGILEVIPKGSSKAQLFRSEYLLGLQVVKLSTIDYLMKLYQNEEYKRDKLPAFIRCSDYHNDIADVEKYVTYMRLPAIEFKYIMDTITNNTECISFTASIEEAETLKKIIEQQDTKTFESFKGDNFEKISQNLCALLNNRKGTIMIGIGNNKSICGVKLTKIEIEDIMKSIMGKFQDKSIFFRYNIDYYELGNHIVVVLKIKALGSVVFDIDGKVYILAKKDIMLAKPQDLVRIGQENFKMSFEIINKLNQKRVQKVNDELKIISKFEQNMELYRKIFNESLSAVDILDIDIIEPNNDNEIDIDDLYMGEENGNTFFVNQWQEPHQKDCYLRVTCPVDNVDFSKISGKAIKGEMGLISLGGAAHYINNGVEEYKIITQIPLISIKINKAYQDYYSLPAIILWLKSPILLYYLSLIHGTYRYLEPNLVFKIPIILSNEMKSGGTIATSAGKIIDIEKLFLSDVGIRIKEISSQTEINEIEKKIDEHNKKVEEEVLKVENIFRGILGLTNNEYDLVMDFIEEQRWESMKCSFSQC